MQSYVRFNVLIVITVMIIVSWDPCHVVLQIFTHVLEEYVSPMLRIEEYALFLLVHSRKWYQ